MKVITGIGGWPGKAPQQAAAAEAAGFDCVTCGELAHDSILTMALAATSTERIGLQTSVTIAFPRSPMVLAMEAWDIHEMSGGRFAIGLGSQVKGHNERRFGGTWAPPAPRMREYIQMMRAVWDSWTTGEPPQFLGKHYTYTLMTPNFNAGPLPYPYPKIGLAMVGDGMARVAGEVADIIMPHGGIMSDKYMREVLLPNVKIGMDRAGKTWKDVEISSSGYLVLGDSDSEIEEKLLQMRTPLSFYGSTRTYHHVLRLHGLDDLGNELHQLSVNGKWDEMRETVTLDHLTELAQTCKYDDLPQFLAEHREYASSTGFIMPTDTPEQEERYRDLMRQVQALATPGVPRGL
ncbi:MAG: LLM class F420-dependent oxidoreductase [Gammaproteobacteria bacterium]|nr:LLM class F420-dependent oxidoreductase [Gammaproteobacteria bacterium]|tara:strand:+ start:4485 stop:5528 length:1044 start_codon:yes stop_codon:yes gene_type:complete